jgi:methionyl aminopeptidase
MAIAIKTPGEIAAMRSSGRLVFAALREVAAACTPGVTSRELDRTAREAIKRAGCEPLLLGYQSAGGVPFPGAACICINEEVVHAVPSDRIVRAGDAVTLDVALRDPLGWCADMAITVAAGAVPNSKADRLGALVRAVLDTAVQRAGPGVRWRELAEEAGRVAAAGGCGLVSGYCGHGIGRAMHENPRVCFGGNEELVLQPGMVITLEPIVVELVDGVTPDLVTQDDGWTVLSSNRAWAAHEERVVAITRRGCEVLTGP